MGIGSLPKTVTLDGFPTFYQAVIRKRGNKKKKFGSQSLATKIIIPLAILEGF